MKTILSKTKQDLASHYLLINHFEIMFSKIPHSFQNFCKYSYSKITSYMHGKIMKIKIC